LFFGVPNAGISPAKIIMACVAAYAATWLSEMAAILRWGGQRSLGAPLLIHLTLHQLGQFVCWFMAWHTHEITWRGNHLRIGKGSRLVDPGQSARQLQPSLTRQAA
jgi:hypothetical protein